MKRYMLGLSLILCVCLAGCVAGQQHGVVGQSYISTSMPVLTLTVKDLPLKTNGRGYGNLQDVSLTGVSVDVHTAVYGAGATGPMAIITHAELDPRWIWTTIVPRFGASYERPEVIGDMGFTAFTYLVPAKSDPFGGIMGETLAEGQEVYWLARYFASRQNFNHDKIILEYREPAPEGLVSMTSLPYGMEETIRSFEERARKAFQAVQGKPENLGRIEEGYPTGVRWQFMRDEFLGPTMELERAENYRF